MCAFFWNFDHLRITLQISDFIWCTKFRAPSLLLPLLIFSSFMLLWWWAYAWLIFSLKWHLLSSFFLLHSTVIELQEAKDSIDEEDPRPTRATWSYITSQLQFLPIKKKKQKLIGVDVYTHIEILIDDGENLLKKWNPNVYV